MGPALPCGCCERFLPAEMIRYSHFHRDTCRVTEYCQDCYDAGCDLETCELEVDDDLLKRDLRLRRGPTDEEMAEVYRSFGVEPPQKGQA